MDHPDQPVLYVGGRRCVFKCHGDVCHDDDEHWVVAGDNSSCELDQVTAEWGEPGKFYDGYFQSHEAAVRFVEKHCDENLHQRLEIEPLPAFRATHTLPVVSGERKAYPICEGVLRYFPAAIAAAAKVSKVGNDKHNPGEPLHHSRGKSTDHSDCILRHLIDLPDDFGRGPGYDEQGLPQVGYLVWRALALAQEWLEQHEGAPLAPNAIPVETQCPTIKPRSATCACATGNSKSSPSGSHGG